MSRRSRAAAVVAAALSLSLLGAACSKKVDRDGTKKLILTQLKDQGVSDQQASCVANLLDKYSDDQLKTLDDEFSKETATPSDLAKDFQTKTVACITENAAGAEATTTSAP